MGIARTQALSASAGFGALFQEAGQASPVAAKFSKAMVKAAADLGSFHDVDPKEVLENLRSGLAGETEPLRKFNIFMSEATLKTFAYKHGIAEAGSELTENQKILARQKFILANVGKAQNDFAETSGSAANQARIQKAVSDDLTASLGKALLPAWQSIQAILIKVTTFMAEHQTVVKAVIGVLGGLAVALLAVRAATLLMNLAFLASPLGLIVLGIAALAAGLVLAYQRSETFRTIVKGALEAVKVAFDLLKDVAVWFINHVDEIWAVAKWTPPLILIRAQIKLLGEAVQAVKELVNWFRDHAAGIWRELSDKLGAILGKIAGFFEDLWKPVDRIVDAFKWMIKNAGRLGGALEKIPFVGGGTGPWAAGDFVPPTGVGNFSGLTSSLWDEAQLASGSFASQIQSYNPASKLPSGAPSDHAVYPAKAFDAMFSPAIGWAHGGARAFFQKMIGRAGIHYVILGDKIWSTDSGLHHYGLGGHENHVHVSSFDKGGWLKPGLTLAMNNTGAPERVGGGGNIIVNIGGSLVQQRDLIRYLRDVVRQGAQDGIYLEPPSPGFA